MNNERMTSETYIICIKQRTLKFTLIHHFQMTIYKTSKTPS